MSYVREDAVKHIVHDYAYLVASGHATQGPLSFPFNHYAERTFLVHCRAFAKFFSSDSDSRDLYAREFALTMPAVTLAAWDTWHTHIDQHLMHLTKGRVKNKRPWTGADNRAILEAFERTWGDFYKNLDTAVKPVFDTELAAMQKQFPEVKLT